jgi:hypothetical protein
MLKWKQVTPLEANQLTRIEYMFGLGGLIREELSKQGLNVEVFLKARLDTQMETTQRPATIAYDILTLLAGELMCLVRPKKSPEEHKQAFADIKELLLQGMDTYRNLPMPVLSPSQIEWFANDLLHKIKKHAETLAVELSPSE